MFELFDRKFKKYVRFWGVSRRDLTRDGLVDAFGGDEYGTEEAGGSLYTIARVQCVQFCYDRRLVTRYLRGGTLVLIHEYVLFPCWRIEEESNWLQWNFERSSWVSNHSFFFLFHFFLFSYLRFYFLTINWYYLISIILLYLPFSIFFLQVTNYFYTRLLG